MADFIEENCTPKKRQKLDLEGIATSVEEEERVAKAGEDREVVIASPNKVNASDNINISTTTGAEVIELENLSAESRKGDDTSVLVREDLGKVASVLAASSSKVRRTEQDCGITEYISTHDGFSAILKQRYSDFLVSERDLDGNTVHLTSTELPAEYVKERKESSVLSKEDLEKLESLAKGEDKEMKVVVQVEDDKEKRTVVHREIREKFPMLESDTCEIDGHKAVRAFHHVPKNKQRRKVDWPKERGEYCHFLLHKENKDTMQAINLLAKCTKVKPDRFSYAGTKDGRAITVQRVAAFRIDVKNLLGMNKVLKNICLGNFEYKKRPLRLGDLTGNSFVIVLRNLLATKDQVDEAMTSVRERGFINYFGLQRFGTGECATNHIGLSLLKSQWSEAIDHILVPRFEKDDPLSRACEHFRMNKNASEAIKLLEGRKCIESFLLEGLSRCGQNDLVNALRSLPRNIRSMYLHAYQSFVWNKVVSRRIKEYGFKPLVGDLVYDKSCQSANESSDNESRGRDVVVKKLTQHDLDSGVYSVNDVVMPLPGYDVVYPDHAAKDWYETQLKSDGLDINDMRHKVKDYSLSGTYRQMIVVPDHVTWTVLRYNDPNVPLALTDLDRLRGNPEPASEEDGKYEALRIEVSLPSSSYATMAVREILKTDTSPAFHSSLNEH